MPSSSTAEPSIIRSTQPEWRAELERLPSLEQTGGLIPSFFLAHGQPLLIHPPELAANSRMSALLETQGPDGTLAHFLRDFGATVTDKYKPKAVVVFSAHWETRDEAVVTDYEDNPLLMDYFGFPDELYKVIFESKGDPAVSRRVVELIQDAGLPARLQSKTETRGQDGRGHAGRGLDHGVFVPFIFMFGEKCPIPVIQVSIDSSLSPQDNYKLGAALEPLRGEGVLIVSGGLTIHTFRDFGAFAPQTAKTIYKSFDAAILEAVEISDPEERKAALFNLVHHPGFRPCHPREEHFVPLYNGAGASDASRGAARVLSGIHGAKTIAFGI